MTMKLLGYLVLIFCSTSASVATYQCTANDHDDYYMYGCYSKDFDDNHLIFNDKDNIDWDDFAGYQKRFACNCSKSAKSLGFPGFLLTFYGECYGVTLATLDNLEINGVEETVCVSNMANGTLINCNRKAHKICTGLAWAGTVYKLKNDSMERTSTNKSYFIPGGLKLTWVESQDYCRAVGADSLAQIDNDEENRAVKAIIEVKHDDSETYWIGLNDRKQRKTFVWNDGHPITLDHWFIYEPKGWEQENCGAVLQKMKGRRWGDTNCGDRKEFVCQKTLYEGTSRFYIATNGSGSLEEMNWSEARNFCQRDGADLARLPTRKNATEVNRIISEFGSDVQYWFGLHDDIGQGKHRWIDGTMQTLENWATGEPGNHACAVISEFSKYRKWASADCNGTKAFVCEKRDKIDGGWSSWSFDGVCSKSCGSGSRARRRYCNNPKPAYFGKNCSHLGSDTDTVSCNIHHCPVDGGWTMWTPYESCSSSCGDGIKTRTRYCTNPAPAHGGKTCIGGDRQIKSCNSGPCPIDGGWTTWSSYGSCSVSCSDGVRARRRYCTNPAPAHGGKVCGGDDTETINCTSGPCPIDGGWSDWAYYGSCSKECGGGLISRSRQCNNPAPRHGGKNCTGNEAEKAPCNTQHCPEYFTPKFREDYLLADFDNARKYCQMQGGDLVEINSAEEEERVRKVFSGTNIQSTKIKSFWIGLSDREKEGDFVWNSGERLSYSNFFPGAPSVDKIRNCIFIMNEYLNRKWKNGWCLNAFPFICERPYKEPVKYFVNFINYAHLPKEVVMVSTQDAAQTTCRVVGGRLAEIDSQEDQDRILLAAQTAPDKTSFWIGLSDVAHEGNFTWKNGRAMRYSNWGAGEHNGGSRENCVEMDSTSGKWNDVACSSHRAHMCQREIKILGIKYVIPPESRTWEDARKACLAMKGDLSSILSNEEHDYVAKELDRLGVEIAWIGLSDRGVEGDYRWSDKYMFNYSNWGTNEPNGGTAENCIHMTRSYKSRKWNDLSCSQSIRFVCKILITP